MRFLELMRESFAQLRRNRLRAALCAAGVAIACGAMTSMVAFAIGLQSEIERPLRELGLLHDVSVRPRLADLNAADRDEAFELDEDSSAPPTEDGPALDDDALQAMAALDGVEAAFPSYRLSNLEVQVGERRRQARAVGIPRGLPWLAMLESVLVAGRDIAPGTAPEALITEQLARSLDLGDNDHALGVEITLKAEGLDRDDSAPASAALAVRHGESKVRVVGVLRPPGIASRFAGRALLLPIDVMRDLPGSSLETMLRRRGRTSRLQLEGYGEAIVRVQRLNDIDTVCKSIRKMGYDARSPLQQLQRVRSFFALVEFLFAAVGCVGLLIACLGILNTLLMSVLERTAEIGVYKALGASSRDVRTLFLGEALALGVVGAGCGLLLAWLVAAAMKLAVDLYAQSQGIEATIVAFRFPPWLIAGSIAITLAMTLLGGLYPASRAARIELIRALRNE